MSDTDALVATVRGDLLSLKKLVQPTAWEYGIIPSEAALDALAAELEAVREMQRLDAQAHKEWCERALAAEAELERVKALWEECERQVGRERRTAYSFRDQGMIHKARLNKALAALREIAETSGPHYQHREIARTAIAEIEGEA